MPYASGATGSVVAASSATGQRDRSRQLVPAALRSRPRAEPTTTGVRTGEASGRQRDRPWIAVGRGGEHVVAGRHDQHLEQQQRSDV